MAVWRMDWKGEDQSSAENYYYSPEVKMTEHLAGPKWKGQMQGIFRRESQLDKVIYQIYGEINKGVKYDFSIEGQNRHIKKRNGFGWGNDEFHFGHKVFELPVRHAAGDSGLPLNIYPDISERCWS